MLLLLLLSLFCRRSFDPEIPSTTPLSESMTAFSQQCGIGVWRTRRRQRQRKSLLMASRSSATLLLSFFLSFMPLVCSFSQIKVSNISKRSIFRATLSVDDVGDLDSDDKRRKDRQQLQIAFVTGNAMKADEVNRILADHGATKGKTPDEPPLVNLKILNVDLPEIQEVDTFAIAKDKALLGSQLANMPCLVEDTSLQFTALGGMPGPYIKWFQDRLKSEGLYKILTAYEDKSATAVCTLAFCPAPHADPVLFTGTCHGTIIAPEEGRGFGWDSIFVPSDESNDGKAFSQMTTDEKCELSHRGKAVRQWADWLGRNQKVLWEQQQGKRPTLGHKGLDFRSDYPEQ